MSTDDAIARFNAVCANPAQATVDRLHAEIEALRAEAKALSNTIGEQRLKLAAAQDEAAALRAQVAATAAQRDLAQEHEAEAVHHMEAAREQRDHAQAEAASLRERLEAAVIDAEEARQTALMDVSIQLLRILVITPPCPTIEDFAIAVRERLEGIEDERDTLRSERDEALAIQAEQRERLVVAESEVASLRTHVLNRDERLRVVEAERDDWEARARWAESELKSAMAHLRNGDPTKGPGEQGE